MKYHKYHGLGNDYIVIDPRECSNGLSADQILRICHRNYGLGADGILLGPFDADQADAGVRIFNPDGSEAEKSGNGLRIFARHLWDKTVVEKTDLSLSTEGGMVHCQLDENSGLISVDMGTITFQSNKIPVAGPHREVLEETMRVAGKDLIISAASIGNPHCVVLQKEISRTETRTLGPELERHPMFPNRTNVQFLKPLDRKNIQIEIWERGAGYTLASGSSSAAAAAVAYRLGLCDSDVAVHMPGGELFIQIGPNYQVALKGPVTRISEGYLHPDLFSQNLPDEY